MEWKSFSAEIKEAGESDLTITHAITTDHRDRVGDRLHPEGAVIEGKPVFLWQHGLDDRVGKEPIGKPLSFKVAEHKGGKGLIVKSQFYPDELGARLWKKAKEGYLSSFSLGFVPIELTPFRDSQGGRDITKFEVLEYSLCAVPCNPYATMITQGKAYAHMVFKMMPDNESVLDKLTQRVKEIVMLRSRPGQCLTPSARNHLVRSIREAAEEAFRSVKK